MEDTLDTINYDGLIKELDEDLQEVIMADMEDAVDYAYVHPVLCEKAVKAIQILLKVNEELRIENENLKHKDV